MSPVPGWKKRCQYLTINLCLLNCKTIFYCFVRCLLFFPHKTYGVLLETIGLHFYLSVVRGDKCIACFYFIFDVRIKILWRVVDVRLCEIKIEPILTVTSDYIWSKTNVVLLLPEIKEIGVYFAVWSIFFSFGMRFRHIVPHKFIA